MSAGSVCLADGDPYQQCSLRPPGGARQGGVPGPVDSARRSPAPGRGRGPRTVLDHHGPSWRHEGRCERSADAARNAGQEAGGGRRGTTRSGGPRRAARRGRRANPRPPRARGPRPSDRTLARIAATAVRERSTKVAVAAPREEAPRCPSAPDPANRSRTAAPSTSPMSANRASRTRSIGSRGAPRGAVAQAAVFPTISRVQEPRECRSGRAPGAQQHVLGGAGGEDPSRGSGAPGSAPGRSRRSRLRRATRRSVALARRTPSRPSPRISRSSSPARQPATASG